MADLTGIFLRSIGNTNAAAVSRPSHPLASERVGLADPRSGASDHRYAAVEQAGHLCASPGPLPARQGEGGVNSGSYIAAMRAARRLANGVAGSGAGAGWIFLVERGNVQSHSSAPI